MSKTWITTIDSDLGPLELKITYDIDSGSWGDYFTPAVPEAVDILEFTVSLKDEPPLNVLEDLKYEIIEYERDRD